jgi:hypothetical protein
VCALLAADAIVPPTAPTIDGLGNLARVGLTFRYFRRTFLQLYRHVAPGLPSQRLPSVFDIVDARYVDRNGNVSCSTHLYTYPAVVLRVDYGARTLTLQYVSDGLGADTDWEAFHVASNVPADAVLPAAQSVRSLLQNAECSWTRRSFQRINEIRKQGVGSYLSGAQM